MSFFSSFWSVREGEVSNGVFYSGGGMYNQQATGEVCPRHVTCVDLLLWKREYEHNHVETNAHI